ncbi:MAG: cytochrome C oxidase subunit IV family protein [Verrucomicrobiota bacterium]
MASSPEEIKKQTKTFLLIGFTLFIFTIITVAMYFVDLGNHALNLTVGMLIAAFKATLVALYFMHLISEKKLIYWVLGFCVVFVIGMLFLTLWADMWTGIGQDLNFDY